jgi:hypothetical protein
MGFAQFGESVWNELRVRCLVRRDVTTTLHAAPALSDRNACHWLASQDLRAPVGWTRRLKRVAPFAFPILPSFFIADLVWAFPPLGVGSCVAALPAFEGSPGLESRCRGSCRWTCTLARRS